MATERELVALLYRADWTRLSLSGVVHGSSFDETVEIAPGRRYRMENADGNWVRGCDGERIWRWFAEPPPDTDDGLAGGPQPPFPVLLIPSWLLSGYSLSVEDDTTVCGRAGVRVVATALARPAGKPMLGMLPAAGFPWPPFVLYEHAVVVVDAELGILLRCEGQHAEHGPDVIEFRTLAAGAEVDPGRFTAPEGSVVGDGSGSGFSWSLGPFEGHGWPFGAAGREAAKTVGGLAAGGLGAALRYAPRKRQDSFAQATGDADPEPSMPADDPVPGLAGDGPAAPVSDEVLHALYRSGLGVRRFTATLHQWMDGAALLESVPESARKAGFGGTGLLVDALLDKARDAGAEHLVRDIRIGGWDKYRIDLTYPAPPAGQDQREWRHRHRSEPRTIACDGQRRWDVYLDRVVVRPAGPLPDEIATLIDGSWLLGCDLSTMSGAEEVVVAGGRRGYRVVAEEWHRPPALPGTFAMFFSGLFLPAVAVVDTESGRLLRVTLYKGGKPVVRHELRDFAAEESDSDSDSDSDSGSDSDSDSGDFGFTPPAGLRIVEEPPDDEPPAPPNPLDSVAKAARGFLGSLRGTNGRLRFWGEEQAAVCH